MAENRRIPVEDLEDPVFQRIRQRLQNTVEGGNGSIKPDELASYFDDLNGPQRAALFREFHPKLGTDFFNTAYRIQGNYDKNLLSQGLGLWNDANAALSDFASLDRDDENFMADTARGLANLPLWVSEGFKTGGQGLAENIFSVDEEDRLNDGSLSDQLSEAAGALGALGKPLQFLKPAAQQTKNIATKIYNNPKALLNPKKLYRGVKENKLPLIAGGAIAGAKSLDKPDGTQDTLVDAEGNETASINSPFEDQVNSGTPKEPESNEAALPGTTAPSIEDPAPEFQQMANAARSIGNIDRKDKSIQANQERNMQKALLAAAGTKLDEQLNKQRDEQRAKERIEGPERRIDRDLREAWLKSPTNKGRIPFEQLPAEEQKEMRQRYIDSRRAGSYNSDDARKERLTQKLRETGSYGVGEIGGGMTEEEFMKKSGMQNPGTILVSNPDGTFTTNETKEAFDRAGGRESASNVFTELGDQGVKGAILDHQLGGDRGVHSLDSLGNEIQLDDLAPGAVRMSSDDVFYGDGRFKSKSDALKYLNRTPNSAPTPEPNVFDEESNDNPYYINDWGPAALLGATLLSRGRVNPKLRVLDQKALPNKTFPANGGLPQKSLSKDQWNAMRSGTNPSGQNISRAGNIMSANRPTLKQAGQNLRDQQGRLVPNDVVRRRMLDENLFR